MSDLFPSDEQQTLDLLISAYLRAEDEVKQAFRDYLDGHKESRRALRKQAREVIRFLNEKADKRYRESEVNIKFIVARLDSGIDVSQLKAIIIVQCRKWKGTEFEDKLRPETLFNATKCESYLGQLDS